VRAGRKFNTIAKIIVLRVGFLCIGALCLGIITPANATASQSQVKTKPKTKKPQKPQLPVLPSGPTGPVQPIPLDSTAPVPPQVSYQNAQLTIVAANSTLGDILRAVRKQTGAEIEIPVATERVVTHLGPGSARDVLAELLNGSRFNYVLLGSPADNAVLTRVVLVAKTGPDNAGAPNNPAITEQPQAGIVQRSGGPGAATLPEVAGDAEATDNNADDAADQAAAEAEQAPGSPDQPAVKTPQQMLQEMQQRQLQLQQQQQGQQQPPAGQPPYPGSGVPQRPPDDK
jgi:hypothetical protein